MDTVSLSKKVVLAAVILTVLSGVSLAQLPGGVATPYLWYDAGELAYNVSTVLASDGEAVYDWDDRIGSTRVSRVVSAGGEIYFRAPSSSEAMNFNPTIHFDNTLYARFAEFNSDNVFGLTGDQSLTVFTVSESNLIPIGMPQGLFEVGVGNSSAFTVQLTHNNTVLKPAVTNGDVKTDRLGDVDVIQDTAHLVTASYESGNDTDFLAGSKLYQNGILTNGAAATTGTNGFNLNSTVFRIGRGGNNGNFQMRGYISEVIVYNAILSDSDRNKVESYLALKYGITLDNSGGGDAGDYTSSGSVLLWDASLNAAYHNDVAGIGTDNGSALTQTTSKSENLDTVVSIGSATDQATGEFLVWGNDNGSVSVAETTDKPATVDERLAREWKFQEAGGDVGNVTVGFDLAKQTALTDTGNAANYSLLVDSDGTFINATVVTSGRTFNGDVIEFTYNLDDATNAYFTLGYSTATFRRRVIIVESN